MEINLPFHQQRIQSIDILRGIIMLIMALDHVRDFFSNAQVNPLDLTQTTSILFFTRWVTHFCAPTFIFLSGTSAYLSLSKKSKKQASVFLLARGIWLIFLELTVIGFGWQFDIRFHMVFAQVIWVIGCSMVILSALIYLKPLFVGVFGLILIAGHNVFDYIKADQLGDYKLLWIILHQRGYYHVNSYETIYLLYPLIPWVGVMATGYAFGVLFRQASGKRRAIFINTGLGALFLFVVLRFLDIYGDPYPWQLQNSWWMNIIAFVNCEKYPPSLLYLLMTLGVSILALGLLENTNNKLTNIFIVYGRVPLFYYILHIYLIHILELITGLIKGLTADDFRMVGLSSLKTYGFSLPVVYTIWLLIIIALYFPCCWYMNLKKQRRYWWLSYL